MVVNAIRGTKRSWGGRLLALSMGLAFLTASCSKSTYLYVSSSDRRAFFKVPANWKFYDKRQILVGTGRSLSGQTDRQFPWLIAFDSDPNPSLDHVLRDYAPKYPIVFAQVEKLPFSLQDTLSLQSLRNIFYPVDQLLQENAAEILSYKNIVLPGGLHGNRVIYDVIPQGTSGIASGVPVIRVDQTGVVDASGQTLYLFLVRCESHCFRDNKALLEQIADSWTVKER